MAPPSLNPPHTSFWRLTAGVLAFQSVALAVVLGLDARLHYGMVEFLLIPFLSGFAAGRYSRDRRQGLKAVFLTLGLWLAFLLVMQWEAIGCVVMSLPLMCPFIWGAVIFGGRYRMIPAGKGPNQLKTLPSVGLASVLVAAESERLWGRFDRVESLSTTQDFPASAEACWSKIQAMERVEGAQPFLMGIALPAPLRCTLEFPGVGSRRICEFDVGRIVERVTEWEPPRRMAFAVEESTLPYLSWLGFESAAYDFHPLPEGGCRVTRETTIRTTLRPAWYWRSFENWGVQSEHRYLFSAVKASLDRTGTNP